MLYSCHLLPSPLAWSFVSRFSHFDVDRDVLTAILLVFIRWIIVSSTVVVWDWCMSILIVLTRRSSLRGRLWYRSVVVLFDRGHPRFWNFNFLIPSDVVRVKSYVNGLLNPTGVPVWVAVNNINLVPKRIVPGLISIFWDGRGLSSWKPYIYVMFLITKLFYLLTQCEIKSNVVYSKFIQSLFKVYYSIL